MLEESKTNIFCQATLSLPRYSGRREGTQHILLLVPAATYSTQLDELKWLPLVPKQSSEQRIIDCRILSKIPGIVRFRWRSCIKSKWWSNIFLINIKYSVFFRCSHYFVYPLYICINESRFFLFSLSLLHRA